MFFGSIGYVLFLLLLPLFLIWMMGVVLTGGRQLYWLNPASYWISGVLSATLAGQVVQCGPSEAAYFNPPSGQTCAEFASDFVKTAGRGYLMNPSDTAACGYCPYVDGSEYLRNMGVDVDTKWRNFGIFLVFCFTNWM
jgi:ABC-type multidrug transport system permease subunit